MRREESQQTLLNGRNAQLVLHLYENRSSFWREKWDVPASLTQPEIAKAMNIVRSNVSKYIHGLVADGYIEIEIKHILENSGRKKSAYFLTSKGNQMADAILRSI
jgi:DNA-binding MarR family transcriptional regulator